MKKDNIKINGKTLNLSKVLVPYKKKTVKDFINEISPNIESIINTARRNGKKAFKDTDDFKRWLIANQEGYNKFNFEIYEYFVHKFNL